MPSTRSALLRPTIKRSGLVRAATASDRSAARPIGTDCRCRCDVRPGAPPARPRSRCTRRPRPRTCEVRWMWTGLPQPPPASSTSAIFETVRMSTTTWIISVKRESGLGDALVPAERAATQIRRLERQRRHLRHDRIERDRRYDEVGALDELAELFQIVILSLSQWPRHVFHPSRQGRVEAAELWHSMRREANVAKLKVMCARLMHVAVGALGKAFAEGSGMRSRSTSALSAPCRANSIAARPPML